MNKNLYAILLGFIFITGCYYDNEEDLYKSTVTSTTSTTVTTSTTSTTATTISYASDIQPLIANNCATPGCHVSGAQTPDLSTYTKLKNNIAIVKSRAIDQRNMPAAAPLSNADLAKLQGWIDAGSPNN